MEQKKEDKVRKEAPGNPASKLHVLISGDQYLLPFKLFEDTIKEESGIELQYTTISSGDFYAEVKESLFRRKGSYDLAVIQPSWLPEFALAKVIVPLTQYTEILDPENDDIFKPYLELYCKYGDLLYSLPFDGDVRIYYYRRDLIENNDERRNFKAKYGYDLEVPQTLEQAYDFAQFFTRKKGELLAGKQLEEDFYGTGMVLGRGWCHYEWMDHFVAYNGLYFNENFEPAINSEAGIQALDDIKRLITYAPPDTLKSDYTMNRDAFLNGRLASLVLWSDMYKFVFHSDLSMVLDKVGVSSIPGVEKDNRLHFRATMPHGRVMVVSSSSKIPEKAFWVASYMSTKASIDYTLDPRTNCDPFRYSHTKRADILSDYLSYFSGKEVDLTECEQYLTVVANSMSSGVPDLAIPSMRDYIDILDLYIHRVLLGELDSEQALDEVADRWEELSNSVGYEGQKDAWEILYGSWKKLWMFE
ncbi:MAG: extracellular solute-binding protein [Spirochaetota bacterium]|nr:MAG: extracellular solute-binding protein [Spirochaetota bacterium]